MNPLFNKTDKYRESNLPYDLSKKKQSSHAAGSRLSYNEYKTLISTPMGYVMRYPNNQTPIASSKSSGESSSRDTTHTATTPAFKPLNPTKLSSHAQPSTSAMARAHMRDAAESNMQSSSNRMPVASEPIPKYCKVQNKEAVHPVHRRTTPLRIDDSGCLKINLPNAITPKDCQQILRNTHISSSRPISVVLDKEAYPKEFMTSKDQIYKIDVVAADSKSYVSLFSSRPDPVNYPRNFVKFVHSVTKKNDNYIERQSKFYHKGNTLACASVCMMERCKKDPAVSSTTDSTASTSAASVPHFKPNVSTKK